MKRELSDVPWWEWVLTFLLLSSIIIIPIFLEWRYEKEIEDYKLETIGYFNGKSQFHRVSKDYTIEFEFWTLTNQFIKSRTSVPSEFQLYIYLGYPVKINYSSKDPTTSRVIFSEGIPETFLIEEADTLIQGIAEIKKIEIDRNNGDIGKHLGYFVLFSYWHGNYEYTSFGYANNTRNLNLGDKFEVKIFKTKPFYAFIDFDKPIR